MGALVVFDVTKRSTFEDAIKWIRELRQGAEPGVVIMLVGNKVDLCEPGAGRVQRQVTTEEAQKVASTQHLLYQETSAQRGYNVDNAFTTLFQG